MIQQQQQDTDDQQQQEDLVEIKSWIDLTNVLVDRYPDQQMQFTSEQRIHLKEKGYYEPAPIQKMVLPYLLKERTSEIFFYIKSPTGTGKTLSFIFPMIFFIEQENLYAITQNNEGKAQYQPYALIMTGQHPLLRQIRDDFDDLIPPDLKQKGLKVQHLDKGDQDDNLFGQVLCAVPEKIRQLLQKKFLSLQRIKYVVVDEADSTIIGDKQNTVLAIIKLLIRTGNLDWKMIVCGATINLEQLQSHFKSSLEDVEEIQEQKNFFDMKFFNYRIELDNIFHYYYETQKDAVEEMDDFLIQSILETMDQFDRAQIMVFFNGKVKCENISKKLMNNPKLQFLVQRNLICEVRSNLDGEVISRQEQQQIIEQFRSEKKKLMLCSDLMGRGMNFRKVRLVINYGVPRVYNNGPIDIRRYEQRVGRTGRMEDLGVAITIFDPTCYGLEAPEQDIFKFWNKQDIKYKKYSNQDFLDQLTKVVEETQKNQNY